ncbi:hypothetical protein HHK36_017834 [Tetracentron sinense]|uniref:EF-hand domain-containing protein n=1 Tax=Tetracentron sinense TaxID=13715 RepID=A0A834YYL3_TETSI|nr:hypothetical protein HHK36_017834 [Tetracentron sinense]
MKLTKINPKYLFRSKKNPSASLSNPPSFSSGTSSSSDSQAPKLKGVDDGVGGTVTPTTVLPSHSHKISDINFELVQAFKLIDKDGDGKITRRELETLLIRLGAEPPNQEEMLMMMTEVDPDGDGCISLEEFGAISSAFGPACGPELHDTFNFFDKDGDGKISAEELLGVFSAIGDDKCTLEDCKRMIGGVDMDGDGFVCFEEFSRMMKKERR